ncbi:MAG: cyanophycinase, partial [Flavobacteriales bacterium]
MTRLLITIISYCITLTACNDPQTSYEPKELASANAKGKLYIIGGGDHTPEVLERMIAAAGIDSTHYIAVLPMSSSEHDSAFIYFSNDVREVYPVRCINMSFSEADLINQPKLDSIINARLIFITGGDQNEFMTVAHDTPLQDALYEAFENGALIAGTSSGASVMSDVMLTGDENFSPEYAATYDKLWKGNGIYQQGLGLLKGAIIDQHFVAHSRYNRLLSAICDHPGQAGIGIDEGTALLVEGRRCSVVGESQVIVFEPVDSCNVYFNHIGMRDVRMNIYTS